MRNGSTNADVIAVPASSRPTLDVRTGAPTKLLFLGLLVAGIGFTVYSLNRDINNSGATLTFLPFVLLGVSLLIALGFEFVNGFHDTANAVATAEKTTNVRNDMYMIDETLRTFGKQKNPTFDGQTAKQVSGYSKALDNETKFIPFWVKVAVAIALGLGTKIGWKRIVVTVGEKIGKQHLTYGQGASAELVAMTTIAAADMYGLPVSTTQVLSSGVAGTMAANGSGLQWSTVRNLAMAWVLTLPAAIALSGGLYFVFRHLI